MVSYAENDLLLLLSPPIPGAFKSDLIIKGGLRTRASILGTHFLEQEPAS